MDGGFEVRGGIVMRVVWLVDVWVYSYTGVLKGMVSVIETG